MTIVAAADGSALGNPGPAGWGWYVDEGCWASGGWPRGTNNMGELMAVLDLLQQTAHADDDLVIFCDSTYVINTVTQWMAGWKRRGWRKKDGKPVLNVDLVRAIDEAMTGRRVRFEWVKGHAGHPLNEAADRCAVAAANAFREGRAPDPGPGFPGAGAAQHPDATPGQSDPEDDLFTVGEAVPRPAVATAVSPSHDAGGKGGRVASVAVLSDIHGVLPVLDAVLAEPDLLAADLVVVCGDHAAGPMPVEVLDRLVGLGSRCVLVRGNADRELVDLARGGTCEHPESVWAAAQLRPDQVELLAGLPHPVVLEVDGFGPVVFCHGTPRDDEEVVLVDTRLEKWAEVFAELPVEARTVVGGHTHMPFVRLVDRRLVINPGSIGMPYGRPGGSWALLRSGQVELRHTVVDLEEAVAAAVKRSGYPDRQAWADEYLRSANSDADAIRAFGPRDGR